MRNSVLSTFFIIIVSVIFASIFFIEKSDFRVIFINSVGDSILIKTQRHNILIDTAATPKMINKYLNFYEGLDFVFLTHCDKDHIRYILNNYYNLIFPKIFAPSYCKDKLSKIAANNIFLLKAGDTIKIGETKIFVLWPEEIKEYTKNKDALVILLKHKDKKFLFTSDIPKQIERKLAYTYKQLLQSDVLKIAHHGSKTSSDEQFIATVLPKFAIITKSNPKYKHPHTQTLHTLDKFSIQTFILKDVKKDIVFYVDKKGELSYYFK